MLPLPYATLDVIRRAIKARQLVSFVHKSTRLVAEPHCLALSPRYGAYIIGAFIVAEARFEFFRYAEIRDLEVSHQSFEEVRPEYNRTDRRIGTIDTSVPRSRREHA